MLYICNENNDIQMVQYALIVVAIAVVVAGFCVWKISGIHKEFDDSFDSFGNMGDYDPHNINSYGE